MGGGNKSILSAIEELNLKPKIYIAHDLDKDNRDLLLKRKITFVLHHNLKNDLKQVFSAFLSYIGLHSHQPNFIASNIEVVTPLNLPK